MLTEIQPRETLEQFAKNPNWINSSLEALAGDFMVAWSESNLEWYRGHYIENNKTLFDIQRGRVVGTDGGVEEQKEFNQELEEWFLNNDTGLAVGISPKGGKFNHPDNQLQLYRIAYEWLKDEDEKIIGQRKVLLCAAHQFAYTFENPETIRRFIFPQEDSEEAVIEIIKWLKNISTKKVSDANVNYSGVYKQAVNFAAQVKQGINPNYVFSQMDQSQFLGQNAIGCAGINTAGGFGYTETMTMNLNPEAGKFVKNCGACGVSINAIIHAGYQCSSCKGIYQGC